MKFWQKYKAKRELRKKLKKARFIDFYGVFKLDLSLGDIKEARTQSFINKGDYSRSEYSIIILYKNLILKRFDFGYNKMNRDTYYETLQDFYRSGEYIERLNYYNQLKYGQDVSKLKLMSKEKSINEAIEKAKLMTVGDVKSVKKLTIKY
jgi:hypothetical protein